MHNRPTALIKWSLTYGACGFAAGFVFGALRELVLIPWLGERAGHWAEFPLVTATIAAVGFGIGRRTDLPALVIGLGGAAFLIALESTLAMGVFQTSLSDYLAQYDVTRGALFPFGLLVMALAPLAARLR